jgi:hypothetical protein
MYACGSHASWKSSLEEIYPIEDFILHKSKTKLCNVGLQLDNPHQNSKYIYVDGASTVYHDLFFRAYLSKWIEWNTMDVPQSSEGYLIGWTHGPKNPSWKRYKKPIPALILEHLQ